MNEMYEFIKKIPINVFANYKNACILELTQTKQKISDSTSKLFSAIIMETYDFDYGTTLSHIINNISLDKLANFYHKNFIDSDDGKIIINIE
jgi:secreted Zn-dependent insulinase-like peptidase